jgi:single-strand DNA-binding protein
LHIYTEKGATVMSLNRAMIIGHLGQDPEIRYTPSGLPVVKFSLATDETYLDKAGKRQERVAWHRIVVIGKLALTCNEHLKKGRQVFVEGRLHYREWESNLDGRKQYRTEIVAGRVQFLGLPLEERSESAALADGPMLPNDPDIPFD